MTRLRIEVAPAGAVGWKLTYQSRRVKAARRKADMVGDAVLLARALKAKGALVTLKIKGRNGRVQEERTYPRSSDPRRTRG